MLFSSPDVLPDCRLISPTKLRLRGGQYWQPIFCANCGAPGGLVPEHNMTFAFYLCNPCADKHGAVAGMMPMPDQVFWEQVKQEQLDVHKRELTETELLSIVASDTTPLATLIKQGHT